jgi:hypothetical protein
MHIIDACGRAYRKIHPGWLHHLQRELHQQRQVQWVQRPRLMGQKLLVRRRLVPRTQLVRVRRRGQGQEQQRRERRLVQLLADLSALA